MTQPERHYKIVREEFLAERRQRCIEPPSPDRIKRYVRSALARGGRSSR